MYQWQMLIISVSSGNQSLDLICWYDLSLVEKTKLCYCQTYNFFFYKPIDIDAITLKSDTH